MSQILSQKGGGWDSGCKSLIFIGYCRGRAFYFAPSGLCRDGSDTHGLRRGLILRFAVCVRQTCKRPAAGRQRDRLRYIQFSCRCFAAGTAEAAVAVRRFSVFASDSRKRLSPHGSRCFLIEYKLQRRLRVRAQVRRTAPVDDSGCDSGLLHRGTDFRLLLASSTRSGTDRLCRGRWAGVPFVETSAT